MAECTDAQRRYLDAVLAGDHKAASVRREEIRKEALDPLLLEKTKAAYMANLETRATLSALENQLDAAIGESEARLMAGAWHDEWKAARNG
jgi:hypothetical protein